MKSVPNFKISQKYLTWQKKSTELLSRFSQRHGCRKLLDRAHPVFGDLCKCIDRDVTTGATGATEVAPKFSGTLTLSQPRGADSAHHCRGRRQKYTLVASLGSLFIICPPRFKVLPTPLKGDRFLDPFKYQDKDLCLGKKSRKAPYANHL